MAAYRIFGELTQAAKTETVRPDNGLG